MKFRTKIELAAIHPQIEYGDHVVCLGSCFAEEVGNRLAEIKISVDINPAGILYSPASIARILELAIHTSGLKEEHLVFHDGMWHSFLHHGEFSHMEKTGVIKAADKAHASMLEGLRNAKWLVLTLGTASVFRHMNSQLIVANCHKIPGSEFHRERLSVATCLEALGVVIQLVREVNPTIHVLLTVSPVRHIRDGLHENQLSKATLLLAVEKACMDFENTHYFPSYEICMDDLRDYRFYGKDLVHPSELAVDYIWERFSDVILSEQTRSLAKEILKVRQAMGHRILNRNPDQIKQFARNQLNRIKELGIKFPAHSFDAETAHFNALLDSD